MLCGQQKILPLFVDSPFKVQDLQSGLSEELLTGSWHLDSSWSGYFRAWLLETNTVISEILELETHYTTVSMHTLPEIVESSVVFVQQGLFLGFYRSDHRFHGLEIICSFIFHFNFSWDMNVRRKKKE